MGGPARAGGAVVQLSYNCPASGAGVRVSSSAPRCAARGPHLSTHRAPCAMTASEYRRRAAAVTALPGSRRRARAVTHTCGLSCGARCVARVRLRRGAAQPTMHRGVCPSFEPAELAAVVLTRPGNACRPWSLRLAPPLCARERRWSPSRRAALPLRRQLRAPSALWCARARMSWCCATQTSPTWCAARHTLRARSTSLARRARLISRPERNGSCNPGDARAWVRGR